MSLRGVHTALVTPFADGGLDLDAFAGLCERQLAAGVSGLVPCGTTGETPTLDTGEWEALVEVAVRAAAGRIPVTAGAGTNDTRSTVDRVGRAARLGADAALLVLPYYNKPPPAGLRAHVEAACQVGLPVVLYHVPGRTGQRVAPELMAELVELDGVVGVKEATGDLGYGGQLLARTGKPVLSGDDFTWLPLLSIGGAGVISVVSNVAPAAAVALHRAFVEGRTEEARDLHFRLLPLVAWLFHTTSPTPCKAILARAGLCSPACRLPLVGLDPAEVPPALAAMVEGAL